MVTDWTLIRRLAFELEQRLRATRVVDAGLLADGRVALALRGRGMTTLLAIDAFSSPPLVTLESGELAIAVEPGFVRSLAAALHGMTLTQVRARRGDRLLRLTFASRSRFGVEDELELYVELVPRFGNVVLVKRGVVVAAAKEFSLAQNPSRAVSAGLAYALPPLPPQRALLPKLVQQDNADRNAQLAFFESDEAMREPLYAYRRNGALLQAHLVALAELADATCSREPSLLDILAELRSQRVGAGTHERAQRRRDAVLKRLEQRERKLRDELESLGNKRSSAAERDRLRIEGEQIFATLHELPESDRDEAKDRAAKLFARYKKLGTALPHVEARERVVRGSVEAIEALRWEAQRAADDDVGDVEAAVAQLDGRRAQQSVTSARRKRLPLELRTPGGSRIVVGRSPIENADVTFRIARPNDLWFHAQGIPGAHVVLARDDRSEAPVEDIETAASLAAFFSKAKQNAKVPIDYTLRKHVRKQQDAPPGLVWYTHPKTILAEPRSLEQVR